MHITVKTPKELRHESGLFTVVEVARKLGVNREVIDYHVKHDRCVAPTVQINELPRRYYTTDDVLSLAKYFAGLHKNEQQPTTAGKWTENENERD
ncbi:MerR family transcriptional regulator [Bremerella sp. P1]|uniref:MerR family transcriptional regulator n=1 Tax=Bremerella sp. P1 TaxID=3026424 RepID=UPI002367CF28|nr:MerR family transcriptional regulator [Bremerella sp. P1]WDI43707.1 MerR family transcriptional regulator [Bremerella sp. P1]